METKTLLRKALVKAGGKQSVLASAVAVREEQVSRWFNGKNEPSPKKYGALLKYIGTPIREADRLVGERIREAG